LRSLGCARDFGSGLPLASYRDELTPAKRLKFKSCSRRQLIFVFSLPSKMKLNLERRASSPAEIAATPRERFMGGAALQRCVLIPD